MAFLFQRDIKNSTAYYREASQLLAQDREISKKVKKYNSGRIAAGIFGWLFIVLAIAACAIGYFLLEAMLMYLFIGACVLLVLAIICFIAKGVKKSKLRKIRVLYNRIQAHKL